MSSYPLPNNYLFQSDSLPPKKLLPFHGIFGIEWLEDKRTGKLHLIDFNARPFSSIGHLQDSGLNLSYLYYKELLGTDISDQPLKPVLRHKDWIDLKGDIKSFRQHQRRGDLSIGNWLLSLMRCRSFTFFRWHDLRPSLHILWSMLQHVGSSALRRLGGQL
ncbi:hypothetical protein [endosymbiont of Ridgeia piscesae]|jgi:predicted ATP-grasp superfamily ATP-dependent carboligase|uniref:ATP-grasp domain-containing protein n=1 Tax=endosymbiont of Ridgeia piscesae TaxID=54398 RepID=A0A0T5YUZ6_9GAMM|nr:hypothetical protein [endosymbiont of Ridgeia piscesae]KRT54435.1 hypothetical protein Ga0074115_10573 [endosymbiont of Ridgeia piscesae]KRT58631.1 hypothetical protein Ga0076813_13901 [endosymbiont of Ridgeia piscesae]